MKMTRINLWITSISLCVLCACSEVAITGRSQLNFMPDSMMSSMSLQHYQTFLKENKKSADAQQTERVKRVGRRIAQAITDYCRMRGIQSELQGYDWEFNLVDSNDINAWAMPGGKVVVYTGLLAVAETDADLAVVMGHEVAHVFAKHGAERMSQGMFVQFGGMGLSKALEEKPEATRQLFLSAFGMGAQVGLMLPFSRLHESEADRLGLIFMAMAQYNPEVSIPFWQRMAQAKEGKGQSPELLSTHPSDETRIGRLRRYMDEARDYYQRALRSTQ